MKTAGGKEVLVKARDKKGHSLSSGENIFIFSTFLLLYFLYICIFQFLLLFAPGV